MRFTDWTEKNTSILVKYVTGNFKIQIKPEIHIIIFTLSICNRNSISETEIENLSYKNYCYFKFLYIGKHNWLTKFYTWDYFHNFRLNQKEIFVITLSIYSVKLQTWNLILQLFKLTKIVLMIKYKYKWINCCTRKCKSKNGQICF